MLWGFFAVALPLTLGAVVCTVLYYASPKVMNHVRIIVAYAWFVNVSIVILTPVDVWTTTCLGNGHPASECGSTLPIGVMWSFAYWSAYFLTWLIIPIMQGYEDSGDFTVRQRIQTSVMGNLILIGAVGSLAVLAVIILVATKRMAWDTIVKLAIGASNAFALVTGALLLGFGLVEIPRGIWRHAALAERQRWLSHRVAKTAQKLDQAHQELSTAIVITQATSLQMPRKDPLRPMMDIIEAMAVEDATFKPSGGQIGENDMDYDTDLRSMAALRRRLRNAQDNYYRYKTEYCAVVLEAMELDDTLYNCSMPNGRFFLSSLRPPRTGRLAPLLDFAEWWWRCVFWGCLARAISVLLGATSVAILFAEATLLFPYQALRDLSLFSMLVTAVGMQAELVQLFVFVPLVYFCICTYFALFQLGMFSFYYLLPRHTNSISLLMNCSMVSRYAAPMCYNFLRLIHLNHYDAWSQKLTPLHTVFEKSMKGLPESFERIYPLCIILAAILFAANVHQRLAKALGSAWRRFRFETDDEILDEPGASGSLLTRGPLSPAQHECSTAGLAILKKEKLNLGLGLSLAEHVLPLARNFSPLELETGVVETTTAVHRVSSAGGMPLAHVSPITTKKDESLNGFSIRANQPVSHAANSPAHIASSDTSESDEDELRRSQAPAPRQMAASLYETLLKAASGFGGPSPGTKNAEGGVLVRGGNGEGSQPNSAPGSPETQPHSWMLKVAASNSRSNLLSSESKKWDAKKGLTVDDGGEAGGVPLGSSLPQRQKAAGEEGLRSSSMTSPRAEDGFPREGSGGWGSAVRMRWRDMAQGLRHGTGLEDVLNSVTSRTAGGTMGSPTSPKGTSGRRLDHLFDSLSSRHSREAFGSEDEEDFQIYTRDRNGQARSFF